MTVKRNLYLLLVSWRHIDCSLIVTLSICISITAVCIRILHDLQNTNHALNIYIQLGKVTGRNISNMHNVKDHQADLDCPTRIRQIS